jgi:hypothetical protein
VVRGFTAKVGWRQKEGVTANAKAIGKNIEVRNLKTVCMVREKKGTEKSSHKVPCMNFGVHQGHWQFQIGSGISHPQRPFPAAHQLDQG